MAAIIMPKMGDAMEAGVIVQFLKKVGDTVTADDAVFEIETDKSNVEVPAGEAGVVHAILVAAGAEVKVGDPVLVIGQGAPSANSEPPSPQPLDSSPQHPEGTREGEGVPTLPSLVEGGSRGTSGVGSDGFKPYGESFVGQLPEGLGGSASVLSDPIEIQGSPIIGGGGGNERVKASPLARAIAAAKGVNLA
ncbi:biotin/lipoyl-containing protein, partial [Armatimonas sp.]|uniref:biotin/lipoyl-containing protein n=1 Tax=Armatimonas sp. TaxID=1872638 RepID=UPI003751B1C2